MKVSWPEAHKPNGFIPERSKDNSNLPNYGSFDRTLINNTHLTTDKSVIFDNNDSGLSSEEYEDKSNKVLILSVNDSQVRSSLNSDKNEVITKCLNQDDSASYWNEIPCCSNELNLSVNNEEDTSGLDLDDTGDDVTDNQISDFFVIDLTCDVDKENESVKHETSSYVAVASCATEHIEQCISHDVNTSRALVPVRNNELVRSENQKLVSLSLSILLAALLQAMRCFAQFLENFVIPQR